MKAEAAERIRLLTQIVEGEDDAKTTLDKAIVDMDFTGKKSITFKNLESAVAKFVKRIDYTQLSNYANNFKITADTVSYPRLLEDYNDFKKKRSEYIDILDTIYRKLVISGTGLMELFEDNDMKRTRFIDRYNFKHIIETVGVPKYRLDDDNFMNFVSETEKGVDYTSFYDDFCAYLKKIGKSAEEIKKDAYLRDPKNYWAKDIFDSAHIYFTKNKELSLEDFFKTHGMDSDNQFINPSGLKTAIKTFMPNITDTLLYKIENELHDENKNISIGKFKKIYNVLLQAGGIDNPERLEDNRFNQMVEEIIKKILDRWPDIESFFAKYDYSRYGLVMDQDKFDDALNSLSYYPNTEEKKLILKKLGLGAKKIDIKVFLEYKIQQKGVESLEKDKKIKFDRCFDELKEANEKFHLDLFKDFKNESPYTVDHIPYNDFKRVFEKNKLNFREDEVKILSLPFINPNKQDMINYRQFCDQLNKKVETGANRGRGDPDAFVSQHVLEEKTREIYKEIRHQYGSIEDFFRKYDQGSNYLTGKDFSKGVQDLGITFEYNQLEKLFEKFDKTNQGKIYLTAFNRALEEYADADLRILLDKVVNCLTDSASNFDTFIKKYLRTSYSLKIFDLRTALADKGLNLKSEDIAFLLEGIAIKADKENLLDTEELKKQLYSACERLSISDKNNLRYLFGSGDSKPSESQPSKPGLSKQSRFNMTSPKEEDNRGNKPSFWKDKNEGQSSKWGNNRDDREERDTRDDNRGGNSGYRWAKDFFLDIHFCLANRGEKFYHYFKDSKMDLIDMKRSLTTLGVMLNEKFVDLLGDFKDRYSNFIDLDKFERVFNDFKDDFEIENRKKTANDPFDEIREALRLSKKTFERVFDRGYSKYPGYIDISEFKTIITQELNCFLSPKALSDVIYEVKEKDMISISLLKKHLTNKESDENIDERFVIEKFKAKMKREGLDLASIMNVLKINDNQYIFYENFAKVFERVMPEATGQEIRKAFRFFDKNGDGRISRNEFMRTMEERNDRAEKILLDLKDLIRRTKKKVDFDLFDRERRGYINAEQFNDIIGHLDHTLSRSDLEYLFRKFDEASTGKVYKGAFLRILYDDDEAPYDQDRAKRLYNGLKEKVSKFGYVDLQKYLKYADPDFSGSITPDNFQNFVLNLDREIGPNEARMIFRMLDVGGRGYLNYDNFAKDIMRFDGGGDIDVTLDPEVLREVEWTSEYFEEISYILKVCEIDFETYFHSKEKFKDDFNKKFDYLDIVMTSSTRDKFLSQFQERNDPKRLDLKKMKECFNYFAKNRKNTDDDIKNVHLRQIIKEISSGLKLNGKTIDESFGVYDRYNKGTITQANFDTVLKELGIKNTVNRKILNNELSTPDGLIDYPKFKKLFTDENVPEDLKGVLAKKVINSVRKTITSSGIDPEMVFDKFDRDRSGTINYQEFMSGLHMFDKELREDQISAIFALLDKEKKNLITKFRFLKTFGNINSSDLPLFVLDSPAKGYLQQIHDLKTKQKVDLYNLLRVQSGYFNFAALDKFSLYDIESSKYKEEIEIICEILGDDREGQINFDIFTRCVERAYETIQKKFVKKELKPEEQAKVDTFFANLRKNIQGDSISYEDIFHYKKDPESVPQEEFNDILRTVFYIQPNPLSELAADSLKTHDGKIDFQAFKEALGFKAEKQSELSEFIINLKKKYNNDTTEILKVFDRNGDRSISMREFKSACERSLNLKMEDSETLFHLIAKGESEIKTIDLKNLLEEDTTVNKKMVKELCQYIYQNEFSIQNQFVNFDQKHLNRLSLANIKMVFSSLQKFISEADLEALMKYLKISPEYDGNYNYNAIINAIRDKDFIREDRMDFEQALNRLKDHVLEKSIDIAQGLKHLDFDGTNRLPFKRIEEFFLKHLIIIKSDEREMILNHLKASHDEMVGIADFCDLIYSGLEDDSPKAHLLRQAQYIKKLVADVKSKMRENRYHSIYDVIMGNDTYVPVKTFETKLQPYIMVDDLISSINFKVYKDPELEKKLRGITELAILCDLCLESKNDMINLNLVDMIVRESDQYRGKLSQQDAQFLDSTYNVIRRFIYEDKLNVEDLLSSCKPIKNAIERKAFLQMLTDRIKIPPNENLVKFVRMISDEKGFIECEDVRKNLSSSIPTSTSMTQPTPRYEPENKVSFGPTSNQNTNQNVQGKSTNAIPLTESKIVSNPMLQPTNNTNQNDALNNKQGLAPSKTHTGDKFFPNNQLNSSTQQFSNNTTSLNKLPEKPKLQSANTQNFTFTKDFSGNLEADIKEVFNTRNTPNLQRFLFFDDRVEGKVSYEKFNQKVKALVNKVTDNDAKALFISMDVNKTGFVSEPEFRIFFDETTHKGVSKGNLSLPEDMRNEILQLFREMDKDNSGTITLKEMIISFEKIQNHPSEDEIKEIFNKYDKNGDGMISQEEFFEVMEDKIKNDILKIENILTSLREEFKKVDINKTRELTYEQTYQAIINLGVDLKPEDASELMKAIDRDGSNKIDIDEFISFIMSPPDSNNLSTEADAAIFSIKRANKVSITDAMNSFKDMPYNFISSFTTDLMKKGDLLPSSSIKPKTDSSGAIYVDLKLSDDKVVVDPKSKTSKKVQNIESSIQPIASALAANITFKLATGIPIPPLSGNKRQDIIGRELRVCMFNGRKYVSNIVRVPVDWRVEYEDRWYFTPNKITGENTVSLRLANYNPTTEANLIVVFEFILFYRNKDQIVEMSNGWTSIPVSNLQATKTHELNLNGGTPHNLILINQDDVQTNRTGWRYVVKKLSKNIISKLTIEVDSSKDKLKDKDIAELEYLPATTLVNKNAIPLIRAFRNYLGKQLKEAVESGTASPDLLRDNKVRHFLKGVDCPDIFPLLVKFWNNNVVNAKTKAYDYTLEVDVLKTILHNLYLLINCKDFDFNHGDPCAAVNENLANMRNNLANYYLFQGVEEKLIGFKQPISTIGYQNQKINHRPFSIDELIDDDNEERHMDFVSNLKSVLNS